MNKPGDRGSSAGPHARPDRRRLARWVGMAALAAACAAGARAQMQPRARLKGEWLPIILRKDDYNYVVKDGEKRRSDYAGVDIQPASSFGTGFVNISNITVDYDPLKTASAKERSEPNSVAFRYEADVTADHGMSDCIALLPFVTSGSIGTLVLPVGRLAAGRVKHLKVELQSKVDDVGFLHVFSESREIRSTQVTKAYDVQEYFASLRQKSKGVPALELCKFEEANWSVLSDDGRLLATARDRDTHYSVIVYDLAAMKLLCEVTVGKYDEPVRALRWISSNEVALVAGENLKLLNVGRKSCEQLLDGVWSILGAVRKRPEVLVITGYQNGSWTEKYDVHSRKEIDFDEPEAGLIFFNDSGEIRLRLRFDGDRMIYSYKPTADSHWKNLDNGVRQPGLRFDLKGEDILDRVADIHSIGPDGDTLYISSRLGSDLFQLAAFSMKEGVIKRIIASDPKYDLTSADSGLTRLLFRKTSPELIGLIYEAERPKVVWFDPGYAAVQKEIDRTFPDHVNLPVDWSADGTTFIYFSYSDQDPGTYYVFRPLEAKLIPTLVLGDRLQGQELAKMVPFDFAARDGATVHAYVTYPTGPASGPVPLIVNIHGGPTARDVWGFSSTNQYLATRGYAVLQVNYRGSSGYGAAYQNAGLKARLDTVVIDDIADGVHFLVSQGRVDPLRIGVMGGSFGGWATYMSLIKYPDLYRAGVAIAAISHWKQIQKEHRWSDSDQLSYFFWKGLLGGNDFNAQEKFIDPYLRAGEIKQPVYIMHGELDWTVPPEQADLMLQALRKHNAEAKAMSFPKSSHSDWSLEDRVTMLNEIGAFFRQNLAAVPSKKE